MLGNLYYISLYRASIRFKAVSSTCSHTYVPYVTAKVFTQSLLLDSFKVFLFTSLVSSWVLLQFVVLQAFYPIVLIVSYKLGVHFHLQLCLFRCRTLLAGLYLFTCYALRCQLAFRNLISYLGISIQRIKLIRIHRFCPILYKKFLFYKAKSSATLFLRRSEKFRSKPPHSGIWTSIMKRSWLSHKP